MTEFFQSQVYQQLEDAQKALNDALSNADYMAAHAQAIAVAELIKVAVLMADEPDEEVVADHVAEAHIPRRC